MEVRLSNMNAAKGIFTAIERKGRLYRLYLLFSAIADAVRTSLGPKGMDKMVSYFLRESLMLLDLNISIYA